MNILIYSVLNLGFGGGFERWVQEVTTRLARRGHKVTVATTKAGTINDPRILRKIVESDVQVLELGNHQRLPITLPKARQFNSLKKIATKADVIYFNNSFATNELMVFILKRMSKTPVCASYHSALPRPSSFHRRSYHVTINRRISRFFEAHHVLNADRERVLKSWGFKKVYRVPNGVETAKFKPCHKTGAFTVAFVGRLSHQKGFDIFCDLVQESHGESNLQFIICGTGSYFKSAENLVRKFDNVKWLGYCTGNQLIEVYQKSHILIAPSRYEEFLFTSLEAQSCGTPVIASDIDGPRETVMNGLTGLLVKPTSQNFLKAILHFENLWSESKDAYDSYARNARTNALDYDWDTILRKLETMMAETSKV